MSDTHEAFAAEAGPMLRELTVKHGAKINEVADSLLTMAVGIFIGAELDVETLVERVRSIWTESERLLAAHREGGS